MKTIFICLVITFIFNYTYSQTLSVQPKDKKDIGMSINEYSLHVNNADTLVLVYFKANWCEICKKLKPTVEQVFAERKGFIKLYEIDTDENPKINDYFEIDGLPVLVLYKNGQIVWSYVGLLSKTSILDNLDTYQYRLK
ncbi:MAG: thioredoxin family protein [Bacteroidia bacterium]